MITLFGTCRLNGIQQNNQLNNIINYPHTTKEIIQFIRFIKGELIIPFPYNRFCFRTAIMQNRNIEFHPHYDQLLTNSKVIVIEICSIKKYIHNHFYLHHLCVDQRFRECNTPSLMEKLVVEKQSDEEIEMDILFIQQMVHPIPIVIVSHYNSKTNDGHYMEARNHLIHLLETICNKHHIPFVNPTVVLSAYSQEEVMTNDLGHYTDLGLQQFSLFMNEFIKNIIDIT